MVDLVDALAGDIGDLAVAAAAGAVATLGAGGVAVATRDFVGAGLDAPTRDALPATVALFAGALAPIVDALLAVRSVDGVLVPATLGAVPTVGALTGFRASSPVPLPDAPPPCVAAVTGRVAGFDAARAVAADLTRGPAAGGTAPLGVLSRAAALAWACFFASSAELVCLLEEIVARLSMLYSHYP